MMAIAVGITGSLGTGKTTVSTLLGELGAKVYNADKIAHDLIRKGQCCYEPMIELLGEEVLSGSEIDRKKVAAVVFDDPKKLKAIEKIIHPFVLKVIREEINRHREPKSYKEKVLVFDVPLLFESKADRLMDLRIAVVADQSTQISRVVKKMGLSEEQALVRIKAQWPLKEKAQKADMIIDNNDSKLKTRKQVEKIWKKILQIKKNK